MWKDPLPMRPAWKGRAWTRCCHEPAGASRPSSDRGQPKG